MNPGEGSSMQTSVSTEVVKVQNETIEIEQKCEQEMIRAVALTEACCRYDKKVENLKIETDIQKIHSKSMENVCSIVKENIKKQSHLVSNMKYLCLQDIPELLKLKYKMSYDEEEKKLQEAMNKFSYIRKEFEKLDIVQEFIKTKITLKEKKDLFQTTVENVKNEFQKLDKIRRELEKENQKLIINLATESLRSKKLEKELRAQKQRGEKLKANICEKKHMKTNNDEKEKGKVHKEQKFQFMKLNAKRNLPNLERIDLFKIPLFSSMTSKNNANSSDKIELDDGIKVFIHDLKKKPSKIFTNVFPPMKPFDKNVSKVENAFLDKSKYEEKVNKDRAASPERTDSVVDTQNTDLLSFKENIDEIASGKKIHVIENILIKPARRTDERITVQKFQNIERCNTKKVVFNLKEEQYLPKERTILDYVSSSNAAALSASEVAIATDKKTSEMEQIKPSANFNESNDIMEHLGEINDTFSQSGKVEVVDLCSATGQNEDEVSGTSVPIILSSGCEKKTAPSTKSFFEKDENTNDKENVAELNTKHREKEKLQKNSSPTKFRLNEDKSMNIQENRKASKYQFELFDLDDMLKESEALMKSIKRGNPKASDKSLGEPQDKMVKVNDSDDFEGLFLNLQNKGNPSVAPKTEKKSKFNFDTSFSFDMDMERSPTSIKGDKLSGDTFKNNDFEF